MEGIQNFNAFTYKTIDGETITATKQNGTVTLSGDKNGVRQIPLEDFKKEFLATVPKLERTPNADTVSFSTPTFKADEVTAKKEASSGKKWGVGIASAFISGLGQAINGDWGKGIGFFAGNLGLSIAAYSVSPLFAIPALALNIWSIVDAVKNAKAD